MLFTAANENHRLAYLTNVLQTYQEIKLELLMSRFSQFRITSFVWETKTSLTCTLKLCRPLTFTNSYFTQNGHIAKSIKGAL